MARRFTEWEQFPNLSKLQAYQFDEQTGATYIRYNDNTQHELIIRITVSAGITTIDKAFDLWINRAGAIYTGIDNKFIEGVNTPTPLEV